MSNITPIHPKAEAAPPTDGGPGLLDSAAKLVRAAVALYGDHHEPQDVDLQDVDEVLGIAQSRLKDWLAKVSCDDNDSVVFNALDGITVVRALIEAEISPRNGYTISPTAAVLRLAARELEAITEPPKEPEEVAA